MEIPRANFLMVLCVEVLGEIIGQVLLTGVPPKIEEHTLTLVCDPEKSHLHAARSLLLDRVVGNASGCLVVAVNGCWRLLVSQLFSN